MNRILEITCLCLLLAFQLFLSPPAQAQEVEQDLFDLGENASRWRLQADQFTYDRRQGVYIAKGQVTLRSEDRLISADEIRLDAVTRQAILEGEVRIEQGEDWMEGDRAFLDLEKQTGLVENGRGFMAENHFYFSGELIEKLGPKTYHVEEGSFTSCDGDQPSWHFRTKELNVKVDGYGTAKHARFHVGSVPVLYSPYVGFPVNKKRQTGFLTPRLAQSQRLGTDIDLPFFWAISDSVDATFYAHYMSKRGLMAGGELRYITSDEDRGFLRFDYLDDQEDTRTLQGEGLRKVEPGFDGKYYKRWWLRSKQNFTLPHEITGKLDLDLVSDRDYLQEFETGFSGWRESNSEFENMFNRGLINDDTVTTRESMLLLNKLWPSYSLNGEAHYYYNLNTKEDGSTLQQLPLVNFGAARQHLLGTPLVFQGDFGYIDYWRREGTRGHRFDLLPRLAWPLSLDHYLQVEPSVGARETIYLIEEHDEPQDSSVRDQTLQHREIFEARLELASEIKRIFELDGGIWTKAKHTIRPEIVYEYIPEVSQREYPIFDTQDRIASQNRITYSLTNFLFGRADSDPEESDYRRVGRFKIGQSYNISKPDGGFDIETALNERRRLSNIFTQLDLTPRRYLNLTYKNQLSIYDGDFKTHDLRAKLWDKRGDKLDIDYNLIRDEDGKTDFSEIDGKLTVNLQAGVSLYIRSNYSFKEKQNFETEYRVNLNRQCWGISCSYVDKPNDKRIMLGINLLGIGEILPQAVASAE